MIAIGIDGCRGGWVAVTLGPDGARVTVAAAVAWSAQRVLMGTAVALTDPAQRADDHSEIAIRY